MLPLPLLSLLAAWAPTPRHAGSCAAVSFTRVHPVGLASRDDVPPRNGRGEWQSKSYEEERPSMRSGGRSPRSFDEERPSMRGGGRSPRSFDEERPSMRGGGRSPSSFDEERSSMRGGGRPPRSFDEERPSMRGGGRPPRSIDEERPSMRGGGRPPRSFDEERPSMRGGGGRTSRSFDEERPSMRGGGRTSRSFDEERPSMRGGGRPPRSFDEERPSMRGGGRPPRSFDEERPSMRGGGRPPRSFDEERPSMRGGGRPPRSFDEERPSMRGGGGRTSRSFDEERPSMRGGGGRTSRSFDEERPSMRGGGRTSRPAGRGTPRVRPPPSSAQPSRAAPRPAAPRTPQPPLPLPADALLRLRASGIRTLHPLQHAAHAAALRGLDVVVHAETGSGKTLCFVLPTLARLAAAGGGAPRALVLAPTLELAAQTAHVYNSLRPGCAAALARGEESLPQAEVVVGPPAMLLALLREPAAAGGGGGREEPRRRGAARAARLRGDLISGVQVLVLDEADALLMPLGRYATSREKSSRETHPKEAATLTSLLCAARAHELQVLACSATVGRPLRRELASLCARPLELIRAPPAAAAPPAPRARAVGLPRGMDVRVLTHEQDNTIAAIHAALAATDASSPLLFLPPGRSVSAELKLLKQCGLNAVSLTEALLELRAEANALEAAPRGGGEPRLIVAASSEARGIDLPAVDLVLLVGVPPTADAFLHMAGRTARRGEAGEVVVLTTKSSAAQQLGVLGAQLGVDFERNVSHLDGLNQEWAQTWRVHQKVVGAEAKGWSG